MGMGGDWSHAGRFDERVIVDDVTRILVFEWCATHYRAVDAWLPTPEGGWDDTRGLQPGAFHAHTLRFSLLRKFFFADKKDPGITMPAVWNSMRNRLQDDTSELREILDQLLALPALLPRSFIDYVYTDADGRQDVRKGHEPLELLTYGLLLHADVGKVHRLLAQMGNPKRAGLMVLTTPLAEGGRSMSEYVLDTLEEIESARESGAFGHLPEAYPPIW